MPEEGQRAFPAIQAAATNDDDHVRLIGLKGTITIPKSRLPRNTSEEQSASQIQETGLIDSSANPIPTVKEPTLEDSFEPSLQYSGLDGLSTAPRSTSKYPTNLTSEDLFIPSSSMSQQPDTTDAHMSVIYSVGGPLMSQQVVGFLGDNGTFHQPDGYSMQNDNSFERRDSGYAPMRRNRVPVFPDYQSPLGVLDAPYPSNGHGAHNSLERAISFQDPSPDDSAQPISTVPEHRTAPASCSLGHNGQLSHAELSSDQPLIVPVRDVPRLGDWLMSRLDYVEPELQPLVDWPPVEDLTQLRQAFPYSTYIPIEPEDIDFVQPFDVYVEELLKLGSIPAEQRQAAFEAAILGNP